MQDHQNTRTSTPPPFWERLPEIALYPLRGSALFTIITLTLFSVLTLLPGFGWLARVLLWAGLYRYSFEVLRQTADGHMEAPESTFGSDGRVWRLAVLLIIFAAVLVLTAWLAGWVPALLVLLVVALLQPGCMISLALDGSLRRALNPMVTLHLATRIGWPYLAAFGLLFLIQAGTGFLGGLLETHLPPLLNVVLVVPVTCWGMFATFHLLGYLVYQYHQALGLSPDADSIRAERAKVARHLPDQQLIDQAERLAREGDVDGALEALRAQIRSRAVDLQVFELFRQLLRRGQHTDELREHTRLYIHRLLDEKQERRAMAMLREALDGDPDFVPMLPEDADQMAARARMSGQFQLATDTLRAAIKAWPKSPQATAWSLDTAALLSERFGRDEEARAVLQQAMSYCRDEDQQAQLAAALKAIPGAPIS